MKDNKISKAFVMIIEDDPFIADVLEDWLIKAGYRTKVVMDGAKGLEAVESEQPDILLLDIDLPSMDGYEILEQLKARGILENTKVVVVSNTGQIINLNLIRSYGISDVITKSNASPQEIVDEVTKVLTGAFWSKEQGENKTA